MAALEKSTPKKQNGSGRPTSEPSDKRRSIERSVEDAFQKFEKKPEVVPGRRDMIDDFKDIRVEVAEEAAEKAAPPENFKEFTAGKDIQKRNPETIRRKTFRPIYAAGAVLVIAAAVMFFMLKPQKPPAAGNPAGERTLHKIVQPAPKSPLKSQEYKAVQPLRAAPLQSGPEKKAQPIREVPFKSEEVKELLLKWKTAWENSVGKLGDMETFLSFYSDDFTSKGLNKSTWRNDKALKNSSKEWIRLELKDILIAAPGADGRVRVSFLLNYNSSNYSDETHQTLILQRQGDNWKIIEMEAVIEQGGLK